MLARRGIVDGTLARKLIALLSRLAPALPVTLPRDHGAARALAANVAGRQAKIDDRLAALDPVRVVLDAAGVLRDGALGLAEPVRSPLYGVRRHARAPGDCARVIRFHRFGHGLESGGVKGNELTVFEPVAQDHVQHTHEEQKIGSRAHRQIEIGLAADRRQARIHHDQMPSVVLEAPDVIRGDGRALTDIGPGNQQDLCFGDIAPGQWATIHAEGSLVRVTRRHHAQTAVVIHVPRA